MRAILTYHSIDPSGSPISCAPAAFDRHIAWLASGRIRVTGVEELLSLPDTDDAVAITFDDGFRNFAEEAAPRLLAHGLPATVFVVTDHIGRTSAWGGRAAAGVPQLPLMGWDDLLALHARGVQIGSHTRTHADLTRVGAAALADEVAGAAAAIETITGTRPRLFAYPYGSADAASAAVVAATHAHACTTEFEILGQGVRPAWLPRLDAFYFQQPGVLEAWGTPIFDRYVRRRHALRRLRRAPARVARRIQRLAAAR